jgi:tetratricopeptide (TPR) repeat protein
MGERVDTFRRKLEENAENLLFRFSLGQALFEEGEFSDAEETFRLCLEEKQDWMLALLFRGRCLIELKRSDDAIDALRLAVKAAVEQHHEDPEREARALLEQLEARV